MISAAATAEAIETQAVEARLVAAKLRRALLAEVNTRSLHRFGTLAARQLEAFIKRLRTANNDAVFDSVPETAFSGLLDDMVKLYVQLNDVLAMLQRTGLDEQADHRDYLSRIRAQTEQLGDLIETFRLGLDPKFGAMVDEAVGRLRA